MAKMGRPTTDSARKITISTKLSEEESEMLNSYCENHNMTKSEWLHILVKLFFGLESGK